LLSSLQCLEDAPLLKVEACPIDKVHVYYHSDGPHHLNDLKQTELALLTSRQSGLLCVTQSHQEGDQGLLSCVCWLSRGKG